MPNVVASYNAISALRLKPMAQGESVCDDLLAHGSPHATLC